MNKYLILLKPTTSIKRMNEVRDEIQSNFGVVILDSLENLRAIKVEFDPAHYDAITKIKDVWKIEGLKIIKSSNSIISR
jgi:hypothetical protein